MFGQDDLRTGHARRVGVESTDRVLDRAGPLDSFFFMGKCEAERSVDTGGKIG